MQLQLNIIGGLLIALSLVHVIFPKYFSWKKELALLSLINRQIMQVHTFFIALTVFMIGLLCLTSAHDIITTTLGKRIALGLSVFWGIRLIIQFFGYSSMLWRGKTFETIAHIIFSLLWVYLTASFWIVSQG
jgi:hypothetical protein